METKIQSRSSFQNGTIDVVKFLCALLIVTAHFITENAENKVPSFVNYFVSLYVIVVPFFFVCGGYFLFRKIFSEREKGKVYIKNYLKKILIMYLAWSAVYVLFKIAAWIRFGVTFDEITQYLFRAILYSTYKTIWFLPALGIGVLITYLLEKKFGMKITLIVAGCFYLIGALGVSYSFILKGTPAASVLDTYNYFFESTRNGVFNAFPFVTLGALLAAGKIKTDVTEKRSSVVPDLIFTLLFGALFVAEAFLIKTKFSAVNANTLLFLVPFSYFFVKLCLSIPMPSNKVTLWMRKMSTVIFLCQRVFLTALPVLLPESIFASVLSGNCYIGLTAVLISVLAVSALLLLLSKKIKFFSYFC